MPSPPGTVPPPETIPLPDYDYAVFLLAKENTKSTFDLGTLYVRGTLAELSKIERMSAHGSILEVEADVKLAKTQYDALVFRRDVILQRRATKTLNPWKVIGLFREVRRFTAAGERLYTFAQNTSERTKRNLLPMPFAVMPAGADETVVLSQQTSEATSPLEGSLINVFARNASTHSLADTFSISSYYFGSTGDTSDHPNPSDDPAESSGDASPLAAPPLLAVGSFTGAQPDVSPASQVAGPTFINNTYHIKKLYHQSLLARDSAITSPTLNGGTGSNNRGASSNHQL